VAFKEFYKFKNRRPDELFNDFRKVTKIEFTKDEIDEILFMFIAIWESGKIEGAKYPTPSYFLQKMTPYEFDAYCRAVKLYSDMIMTNDVVMKNGDAWMKGESC
jgi:hypothetical protein